MKTQNSIYSSLAHRSSGVFAAFHSIRSLRIGALLFLGAAGAFAQNAPATIDVDANASRHSINPNIYGFGFAAKSDLAATNYMLNRSGGNLTSTYNWQINAANHDSDYFFESILDPPQIAGYDGDTFISQTRSGNAGAQPMLTIPMINYLAKLGPGGAMLWSYSIAKYGAQTASDPYQPDAGNGISAANGKPIAGNNPLDANTLNSVAIQQAWIQHLTNTWGLAASGGLKYYIMDNEPSLWNSTHRDIHPAPVTYAEMLNDYVAYAGALRALDPNAMIVGPEEWSWWALFLSGLDQQNGTGAAASDYNTHNQTYYYPWLLQQLYSYWQSTGKQLLNVLSVHYYPQELSNSDDDSLSAQLIRNQSTRALWDSTYVDPSWFNQVGINGGIVNLIPTLKSWVSQYYPGLQTAITEYNWGDEANLNGATTQADVLGIFGREGLDMSARWTVPRNPSPTYLAMQIYRNYDGKLSTFGDTSVSAAVGNPDNLSSFAAVRTSDGALTVMVINKQQGSTPVTINLANFAASGAAQAYQIASAAQTAITQLGSVAVANNAITVSVPSQSITLFVIPAGNVTPAQPTFSSSASASPNPAVLGSAVTIAATVTCTSNSLTNGSVQVVVLDSNGKTAATQTYSSQTFAAQQSRSYSLALTPATAGVYTVQVDVFSATAQALSANPAAANFTVNVPPPAFTSSVTAPSTAAPGTPVSISLSVTDSGAGGLTNGNVELQIFNSAGSAVATQVWSAQTFTAGEKQSYSYTWTPAATLPVGTYTVDVGVFDSTWATDYYWTTGATISLAAATPAFTSSASASPNPVTLGASVAVTASVTCTANSLTNGSVQVSVLDSKGNTATTQTYTGQSFTAPQAHSYSLTLTPASAGSYTVKVGVFGPTGQQVSSNAAAATITVNAPPPAFTSAVTSPATLTAGGAAAISLTVTETGAGSLTSGNVELQIFNSSGAAVATQVWSAQTFAAGQKQSYSYTWTTSASLAPGSYTVDVGVFDATWTNDYYWSTDATIALSANAPQPAFTTSAVSPSNLTAGGTASISLSVTDTGGPLTNANVELQVFNSAGAAVATQVWSAQSFTAGQKHTYSYSWIAPSTLPPGSYTVEVGVFDSAWTHDYYWNTDATVTIAAPAVKAHSTPQGPSQ